MHRWERLPHPLTTSSGVPLLRRQRILFHSAVLKGVRSASFSIWKEWINSFLSFLSVRVFVFLFLFIPRKNRRPHRIYTQDERKKGQIRFANTKCCSFFAPPTENTLINRSTNFDEAANCYSKRQRLRGIFSQTRNLLIARDTLLHTWKEIQLQIAASLGIHFVFKQNLQCPYH